LNDNFFKNYFLKK